MYTGAASVCTGEIVFVHTCLSTSVVLLLVRVQVG